MSGGWVVAGKRVLIGGLHSPYRTPIAPSPRCGNTKTKSGRNRKRTCVRHAIEFDRALFCEWRGSLDICIYAEYDKNRA